MARTLADRRCVAVPGSRQCPVEAVHHRLSIHLREGREGRVHRRHTRWGRGGFISVTDVPGAFISAYTDVPVPRMSEFLATRSVRPASSLASLERAYPSGNPHPLLRWRSPVAATGGGHTAWWAPGRACATARVCVVGVRGHGGVRLAWELVPGRERAGSSGPKPDKMPREAIH